MRCIVGAAEDFDIRIVREFYVPTGAPQLGEFEPVRGLVALPALNRRGPSKPQGEKSSMDFHIL